MNDEKKQDEVSSQDGQYLTFNIAEQEYGIEIRHVTEIVGIQKITNLPDIPQFIKGVINLRGNVIPVLDVRLRFGMKERDYDERTCIMVININESSVGLIVDTVSEVLTIGKESIEAPPKLGNNRFVRGFGKIENEVKILLDTQKLLFGDELKQIADAMAKKEILN